MDRNRVEMKERNEEGRERKGRKRKEMEGEEEG